MPISAVAQVKLPAGHVVDCCHLPRPHQLRRTALRLSADASRKYCMWLFNQCSQAIILISALCSIVSLTQSEAISIRQHQYDNHVTQADHYVKKKKKRDLKVCPRETLSHTNTNTHTETHSHMCTHRQQHLS